MKVEQELQLVEKAKEDIHAFREIYEFYFPKIFAYLMNRLPDQVICEDLCSEIFVDAIVAIKKFKPQKGARFGSLLYKIAHNKTVDYYKKHKTDIALEKIENFMRSDEDSEGLAKQAEHKRNIAFTMTKLKPRYQLIISLKYFSELDNSEIAETMSIKTSQVAVLLHRATKSFKKQFATFFPESEIF